MIGQFINGKGWEVLCDNLYQFVGYVGHSADDRPNDTDYEVLCQDIIRIDKIGDYIVFNDNEATPTDTVIDYAEIDGDFVRIELNGLIYDCGLTNTYINGEFPQSLDDLYNEYIYLIGK